MHLQNYREKVIKQAIYPIVNSIEREDIGMFCRHCGKEVKETNSWCIYCGARLYYQGEESNEAGREPLIIFSFLEIVILSFVSFGLSLIYTLNWISEDMNELCKGDGKDNPNFIKVVLLGLVTGGVYWIYWEYRQIQRLYEASKGYGVEIKQKGSSILIWYIVGMLVFSVPRLLAMALYDGSTILLPYISGMFFFSVIGLVIVAIEPVVFLYILVYNRNLLAEQYNLGKINVELNKREQAKMSFLAKILCVVGGVLEFIFFMIY